MSRDPYYHSLDGYNAYQSRELLKREYKDGKVYSTYKCSNLGGEVDIFTTVCDPIEGKKEDGILNYIWDNLIDICIKICGVTLIILSAISLIILFVIAWIDWIS